jgi:3-phenylpropionate/trans-cinnamate dioxygenase ferredoxin reductase subunit
MADPFVVVGGGLAAASAVTELREQGYDGPLVVLAREELPPYERPPLSKGYLLGKEPWDKALVHPVAWYAEHDVDLRLGEPATALDQAARTVTSARGTTAYSALLLATGSRPRRLSAAEAAGVAVAYLRDRPDSDLLRERLTGGRRVLLVGAGWIGLEVAAAARTAGAEVTVVETLEQPLERVLGAGLGSRFAALHREHGVDLRLATGVESLTPDGDGAVVRLSGSHPGELAVDLVVAGIGAAPDVARAATAGLAVDDGVLTDDLLRTSAPDVFAAGDIARAHHPVLGRRLRVEHWDNAIQQGRAAARSMLGRGEPYSRLPYFFSDQYDTGLEFRGDPAGHDRLLVDGEGMEFTAWWLAGDRVLAGMHANRWDDGDRLKELVGTTVPAPGALGRPGSPG